MQACAAACTHTCVLRCGLPRKCFEKICVGCVVGHDRWVESWLPSKERLYRYRLEGFRCTQGRRSLLDLENRSLRQSHWQGKTPGRSRDVEGVAVDVRPAVGKASGRRVNQRGQNMGTERVLLSASTQDDSQAKTRIVGRGWGKEHTVGRRRMACQHTRQ
jgi:hypothetical protein